MPEAIVDKKVVQPKTVVEKFEDSSNIPTNGLRSFEFGDKKIMMSQNGPVLVSAWKPRKLSSVEKN